MKFDKEMRERLQALLSTVREAIQTEEITAECSYFLERMARHKLPNWMEEKRYIVIKECESPVRISKINAEQGILTCEEPWGKSFEIRIEEVERWVPQEDECIYFYFSGPVVPCRFLGVDKSELVYYDIQDETKEENPELCTTSLKWIVPESWKYREDCFRYV
ncbi:hypothetical protein AM501_11530 [Aneurinibacillus migulanus]|uniref:Uncharacterized protein n=1 Tax=Aneurinibacillus migulanus TaxID=47500 RepID=A0A0D1YI46_ANEMI|nr:hypothetical protein [Aneurinibacillus migulanus]KIV50798.1 hypothetical protein TS65_28610 [Aneurinibacillus migulanus]KIV58512.1 hypothetical protein TS64_04610 [Aneurinibacillus migulanus]KON97099.1 hypothetical protein AF333_18135 [Aneurinibacillus migulanus]KPD08175.1 hypothetical protein AM501_11530 [Aneurinibacillus migulanus]MCP1357858.1 hypothetical protein [Aneurinibacillus migulanus]